MNRAAFFREQLEREVVISLRVLRQVPEGRNDWRPHPKSMPLGYLAALVAHMPAWVAMMIATDKLDLDDPAQAAAMRASPQNSTADLLALAESSRAKAFQALDGLNGPDDTHLDQEWSFRMGGRIVVSGLRYQQIADTITHLAHHRGQLTVYLRLNEARVPSLYGPSADEPVA